MWQLCIPIKPSGAGICHCPPGLRDCHGSRICDWGSHRNLLLFNPTGSAHTVLQVSHWTRGISYKCDLQVFLFEYWHLWWKAQDFCEGETTNTSRHKQTVTGAFWRELIMKYQLWSPNANVRGKAGERTATHLILPHFKTILLLGTLIFLLCSTINTLKPLDRCTVIVEKKSNCLEIKSCGTAAITKDLIRTLRHHMKNYGRTELVLKQIMWGNSSLPLQPPNSSACSQVWFTLCSPRDSHLGSLYVLKHMHRHSLHCT